MIWTEKYRVMAHDVDMTGRVKISGLMRYMAETACRHMNGTGPTEKELREQDRAFLVARILVEKYGELHHGDEFEVNTWAEISSGVSFGRAFIIKQGETTVAKARSVWTLYDFGEKRFVRVSDIEMKYGPEAPMEMELPRRLSLPDGVTLTGLTGKRVEYGDIDENRHMNNTVYADMFCGCIPEIKNGSAGVRSVFINFSHECRLDEDIDIDAACDGGVWYFRSHRPDGMLNAEARIAVS